LKRNDPDVKWKKKNLCEKPCPVKEKRRAETTRGTRHLPISSTEQTNRNHMDHEDARPKGPET